MALEEISTGRRERRKLETRRRLLAAAQELIAEHGAAAVRISDVTDHADVGFGTFYTYFETKDALIEAVVADAVASVAAAIGTRAMDYPDPAEAASVSYRRFVRFARDEPEVAGVLVALEGADALFENALLPWARHTVERGIEASRFAIDDVELCLTSVAAAALAAIRGTLTGRLTPEADVAGATMMLRAFGLDDAEARAIAQRPLEPVVN